MTNQQLWQAILGGLEVSISKGSFTTWLKGTLITERGDDYIIIGVPSDFHKKWISEKYHAEMLKTLKGIAPEIKEIRYQMGAHAVSTIPNQTQIKPPVKSDHPVVNQPTRQYTETQNQSYNNLNPKYTFETLIIGKNNELAHAGAVAVTKNPGTQYNPLFIYGGVGLGKTHLMQAVGNRIQTGGMKKIVYITAEKFANDYIEAIKSKRMDEFKKEYRNVDMLLIDDIQFMGGKEGFQEEFFHTFNELRDKGKQIIITSDRAPKDILGIEQRLISRFEWGMVADIQAPDLETRMAILRTKMEKRGAVIQEDILFYIAENIQNNVRELEGALNKLAVYQQMENKGLMLEQAKNLLASVISGKKKVTSARKIAESVAEFYNISMDELLKQSRKKEYVKPRQIAMYIIRKELDTSFPSIGEFFSGRDHTTVMHAVDKITQMVNQTDSLKQEVNLILDKLFT